jgi:hypothetical protein
MDLLIGPRLVAHPRVLRAMRARPCIQAATDDDRAGESRVNRQNGKDHAERLSGTSVVESRGETRIDAELRADHLMMGVDIVRSAADQAVDILDVETGIVERILDRLQKQIAGAKLRHPAEPTVTHADNGTAIAQPLRLFSHVFPRASPCDGCV